MSLEMTPGQVQGIGRSLRNIQMIRCALELLFVEGSIRMETWELSYLHDTAAWTSTGQTIHDPISIQAEYLEPLVYTSLLRTVRDTAQHERGMFEATSSIQQKRPETLKRDLLNLLCSLVCCRPIAF
jgi:hypothetical protein